MMNQLFNPKRIRIRVVIKKRTPIPSKAGSNLSRAISIMHKGNRDEATQTQ